MLPPMWPSPTKPIVWRVVEVMAALFLPRDEWAIPPRPSSDSCAPEICGWGKPYPALARGCKASPELAGLWRSAVRVPVVDRQRVAVGVLEDRLLADAAVDHLADELDAARLELGLGGVEIVDVELERQAVRGEVDPERVNLHQRDRDGPGLELAGGHLAPLLPERQPEGLAIELPGGLPVLGRERDEVDAVQQLCLCGHLRNPSIFIPPGTRRAPQGRLLSGLCPSGAPCRRHRGHSSRPRS